MRRDLIRTTAWALAAALLPAAGAVGAPRSVAGTVSRPGAPAPASSVPASTAPASVAPASAARAAALSASVLSASVLSASVLSASAPSAASVPAPSAPETSLRAPALPAADPAGDWGGTLRVGAVALRLVFHITAGDAGGYTATLDSPDQGANGIPVERVTVSGDSIALELPAIQGAYHGVLAADDQRIEGTWSQRGRSWPLVLERVEGDAGPNRPQIPERPYPYDEEEVVFENPDAGIRLAGTFTKAEGAGPFPGVVLVTGSGPQDRNETLLAHPVFLVLADHLTRNGIAVLRYDDRGVGESTGEFGAATTADFASDAAAAVRWLEARDDVGEVGVIGHSEGGLIAPMVANRVAAVDFIVLMAGPGLTGKEILNLQGELIARAMGVAEEDIRTQIASNEAAYRILAEEPDDARARERLRELWLDELSRMTPEQRRQAGLPAGGDEAIVAQRLDQFVTPWFRFFLEYDPAPTLRQVDVPVLALNGGLDLQVPAEQNLAAIREALEAGGNDDVTTRLLPGLNHLFQTAETGAPAEYGRIEETIAPAAMKLMAEWILKTTGS